MTVSVGLFSLCSNLVEAVCDGSTVRRTADGILARARVRAADDIATSNRRLAAQAGELTDLRATVADRERIIATQLDDLIDGNRTLSAQADEVSMLRQTAAGQDRRIAGHADEIARLSADRMVMFNGGPRPLREVATETVERVRVIVSRGAARNVAATFG